MPLVPVAGLILLTYQGGGIDEARGYNYVIAGRVRLCHFWTAQACSPAIRCGGLVLYLSVDPCLSKLQRMSKYESSLKSVQWLLF